MDITSALQTMQGLSASVSGRTAIFYSGKDSNGVFNYTSAFECQQKYSDSYYTIKDTEVGQYLDRTFQADAKLANGAITQAQYDALWTQASQQFASEARGNVIAFVDGTVRASSTFVQTELGTLLADGGVTSINGISVDILTAANSVGNAAAVLQLIGPVSQCFDPHGPNGPTPTGTAPVTEPTVQQLQDALRQDHDGPTAAPDIIESNQSSGLSIFGYGLAIGAGAAAVIFASPEIAAGVLLLTLMKAANAGEVDSAATPGELLQQQGAAQAASATQAAAEVAYLKLMADIPNGSSSGGALQGVPDNISSFEYLKSIATAGVTAQYKDGDGATVNVELKNNGSQFSYDETRVGPNGVPNPESLKLVADVEGGETALRNVSRTNSDGSGKDTLFDPNNTHPYGKLDVSKNSTGQVTTVQITLDQAVAAAGTVGQVLGSAIGAALGGNDLASRTVAGAVAGLIGEKLAQTFAASLAIDASSQVVGNFATITGFDVAHAGIGAISSFITAELGSALHISGFGGQLFNAAANGFTISVLDQVRGSVVQGLTFEAAIDAIDWGGAVAGAVNGLNINVAALLGSYLGHELVPAKTHEGAVGGQLLGAVGSALGALIGGVGNFILPGVGALLGTILGTWIGNHLGTPPSPSAVDLLDQAGDHYGFGHYQSSDGGGYDAPDQMAAAAAAIINTYLTAVNGAAFDHSRQATVGYIKASDVLYVSGVPGHTDRSFIDVNDSVHAVALDVLQHTEVIGGDLLMKRAHQDSPSNVPEAGPADGGMPGQSQISGAEQLVTMGADLRVAQDYENYLNNREAINALMAANPDSAFTAGWIATFARVNDLGLNHMNASDFLGGLVGYLDSVNKAGLGAEAANATVSRGAGNTVVVEIKIPNSTEVPGSLAAFADSVTVTSNASGQTLQFIVDSGVVANGYHFYGPGPTAGDGANDLWIGAANAENTFTGTGGHDILVGGAANDVIYGGGGFDFIDGGAGVDYLFGQDGNDILRGGAGIDFLYGGLGNDTYVFNPGDGADTVLDEVSVTTDTSHWKDEWRDDDGDGVNEFHHDWIVETTTNHPDAGTDTLLFGPGITDVTTVLSGNDLIVTVHDPASPNGQDTITLRNWTDPKDRIEFFKFDDGSIWNMAGTGPSTYVIDNIGSARLTLVGSSYFFNTAGAGPALTYNGAAVVAGQTSGWLPLGAEQTATGYEVAWKNSATGLYMVWTTDANGNYLSTPLDGVAASSLALKLMENSFHQDLNGDGRIGPVTTVHPDRNRRVKARGVVRAGGWRYARRASAGMDCIRKRFA